MDMKEDHFQSHEQKEERDCLKELISMENKYPQLGLILGTNRLRKEDFTHFLYMDAISD